jgi:hypothetical protein
VAGRLDLIAFRHLYRWQLDVIPALPELMMLQFDPKL